MADKSTQPTTAAQVPRLLVLLRCDDDAVGAALAAELGATAEGREVLVSGGPPSAEQGAARARSAATLADWLDGLSPSYSLTEVVDPSDRLALADELRTLGDQRLLALATRERWLDAAAAMASPALPPIDASLNGPPVVVLRVSALELDAVAAHCQHFEAARPLVLVVRPTAAPSAPSAPAWLTVVEVGPPGPAPTAANGSTADIDSLAEESRHAMNERR